MIDIDKATRAAVKTGKVSFGVNSAIRDAKTGKTKLILLASNCPKSSSDDIQYYCKLSNTPVISYKGSSIDLAEVCGQPFVVSALTIKEVGDSEILDLVKARPEDT